MAVHPRRGEPTAAVGLRVANAHDLLKIHELEKLCFPSPWSLSSFKRELSLPFSRLTVAHPMDYPGAALSGFLCRWLVADESHILNIAVHPSLRRHGIGSILMAHAIAEAKAKETRLVTLEVRRSNVAARCLYRKFGFEEQRLRRDYYAPGEDAV